MSAERYGNFGCLITAILFFLLLLPLLTSPPDRVLQPGQGFWPLLYIAFLLASPFFSRLISFSLSLIFDPIEKSRLRREQKIKYEQARLRDLEEARERERNARILAEKEAATKKLMTEQRLTEIQSESERIVRGLPGKISAADKTIDLAEREFKEGVFAPFWDAVEAAAKILATYDADIKRLMDSARLYAKTTSSFEKAVPPFRFDLRVLPDATRTSARLQVVVRQAQRDPHFATIYELRKNNQLLVAGFSSLGEALTNLTLRIQDSLSDLKSCMSEKIDGIASEHRINRDALFSALNSAIEDAANAHSEEMEFSSREAEARRMHEKKERELLEGIQRQTKPKQ